MLQNVERIPVSPVFVGRSAELAALEAARERASAGEPQALLIGGDAGVGKTRVLEEFTARAAAEGAFVALGGCVEIGAEGLPYAPLVTALRALHRALGPELDAALSGSEGHLARLLPELGEAVAEPHDQYGRARLFDHLARLFERITADRTVVLAVEDLHWADRSTRETLLYLIRSIRTGYRLVIVGTYRTDDLHRRHPLRPFLAELERLRTVQRLELPRLGRAEVAAQLAGILGSAPDAPLAARIHRRSDGIPFFVEELAVSHQQGCTSGLTDSLRDLLLVRVEGLPEDTQRMLRVLAEGGSSVEYALLAAVLDDLSEDRLAAALRSAVDANIIRPTDDWAGYRFRHALVREAVADDLLPGESGRFNRRYAEAIEADPSLVPADARAARLTRYWTCAGDPSRALPHALHAARAARRRNAFAEQFQMLGRALELWHLVPDEVLAGLRDIDYAESYPACACEDPSHDHSALNYLDALAEAVVAARLSGERERGYVLTKEGLRLVDEREDPVRAAWFWYQRSRMAGSTGRSDGRPELQRARALLAALPPSAVQSEVLSRLAACEMVDAPNEEDLVTAERAVEIAREVGDERAELHARITLAVLRTHFGQAVQGFDDLVGVLGRARESTDPDVVSRAYVNFSDVYEGLGRSEDAARLAAEGAAYVAAFGRSSPDLLVLLGNQAESLLSLGRVEEAAVLLERARDEVPAGPRKHTTFPERLRAELALLRGDVEEAAAALCRARESVVLQQAQYLLPLFDVAVRLHTRQGRYAEARGELERALDYAPRGRQARYTWPLLVHGATSLADARGLPGAEGGPAERAVLLERIREAAAAQPVHGPVTVAWSALLTAELARAEGASEPGLYHRAVELLEATGLLYPLCEALYRAAEAEAAAGQERREEAARLLRRADEVARRRGDLHLQGEILLLAGRTRLPLEEQQPKPAERQEAADADPLDGYGLTRRERDVLRLVVEGRSNRGIAEELYISPKTASVHVSHILGKLAVGSRGEAAALAHRLRLLPG
ncbi:helix-turn-helix transcriptional regulator [Phaeacidiphilus oryzae]